MLTLYAALAWAPAARPWMDRADPPSARAVALLKAMTLDEKLTLFHGSCGGALHQGAHVCTCMFARGVSVGWPLCPAYAMPVPCLCHACAMRMPGPSHMPGPSGVSGYVGNVCENARLGIPALKMNDGPQGFRDNEHLGSTTAWPCSLAIGATFDTEAAREWGAGMGAEFYGKGATPC